MSATRIDPEVVNRFTTSSLTDDDLTPIPCSLEDVEGFEVDLVAQGTVPPSKAPEEAIVSYEELLTAIRGA
jgi:hypothetical protein